MDQTALGHPDAWLSKSMLHSVRAYGVKLVLECIHFSPFPSGQHVGRVCEAEQSKALDPLNDNATATMSNIGISFW